MINPAHVVEHLVKLVRTRFGDDNQSPPTDEERELANHLFEIIIELDNGTAVLETDWTLTHDTDGHDTVEEEDNEDEPSQNSQEWETLSLVTESSTENFTLDYMKSVLECYDKHGWGRVQKRFKRVKYRKYIYRFRDYVQQNGTNAEKLQKLHIELFEKFSILLMKREIIHDFDLKRWALQMAKELNLPQFKASDAWILIFKKSHNIVSRKITKFVTKTCLQNAEVIAQSARNFVESAQVKMEIYHHDNILNTDQSGFNYLLKSNRMLSVKGEKSTSAVKESKNKQTHSYTIQPIVSMSGKLISALLICLQEQDGKFGKIVQKSVSEVAAKCKNVIIFCSKSGKLQKPLVKLWANEILYKSSEFKSLLLLDSWTGQTDNELFLCEDQDKECERMYIPENTTDKIQPLDVYGFRQWKICVRKMFSHVILNQIGTDLTSRINIITMHSLIHNQLAANIFRNMWLYMHGTNLDIFWRGLSLF
ncbi:uncharacterized protein LOC110847661 [Folsomia candida]|uniref:uncharacterized protein LOC110847661 n=1 Tax=Folsomia candida TaxID=158441 RepID=UPI001604EFD7|nr:uncharacterized protein LOC110847661 [Folsomia candida]